MGPRIFLCYLLDVPPGTAKIVKPKELADPVLVVHQNGDIVVTTAICPHEDVEFDENPPDDGLLTCPGHGYQFNLKTGQCVHDRSLRLTRYRASIEGDQVVIDGIPLPR